MAFQSYPDVLQTLQTAAAGPTLSEAAPATNVILDERVSDARATDFFAFNGKEPPQINSTVSFFEQHRTYAKERLVHQPVAATFDADNGSNHFVASDMAVVRLERLDGLCERSNVRNVNSAQIRIWIDAWLAARQAGTQPEENTELGLQKWLKRLNGSSGRLSSLRLPRWNHC
jgi:hypothetical protein